MIIRNYLFLLVSVIAIACSDSGQDNPVAVEEPGSQLDLTEADAWLGNFVATETGFDGGSMIIVDKELGVVHKSAFGDHSEDTVVLLASTSKVPTVMLLLALAEDDANVDFAMDAPIAKYLPWQGVWDEAITTEHLVSNRSGIPGIFKMRSNPVSYFPHICQYESSGTLLSCGEKLYTTPLEDFPSIPSDSAFDYGGSQWHIAGVVAETVGETNWNQLWDRYIGQPCGLEVFRYGNFMFFPQSWDGNPANLIGLDNPNMEGGAISNLDDYAKLIAMHLNDGYCGDNEVLSSESLRSMREVRSAPGTLGELSSSYADDLGYGYGMGWITIHEEGDVTPTLFFDPGLWGSISWIDIEREYGGVVLFDNYSGDASPAALGVISELIPHITVAIDATR